MAAVLPRMRPAFKVAASSPRRRAGKPIIVDDLDPPKNPWEPYRLKLLPKKINGHWYKAGDTVWRKFVLSPGGGFYVYGDDFDRLRNDK